MHHETYAHILAYEEQLDTAFAFAKVLVFMLLKQVTLDKFFLMENITLGSGWLIITEK